MDKFSTIFNDPERPPRKVNGRIISSANGVYQIADDTSIVSLRVESSNCAVKKLVNGKFIKILYPKLDYETKSILLTEKSRVYDAPTIDNCLGTPALEVQPQEVKIPEIESSISIDSLKDYEPGKVSE